jgi:hypothetical protein
MCVKIKESQDTDRPLTLDDFKDVIADQKAWKAQNNDYSEVTGKAVDKEIEEMLAMPLRDLKNSSSGNGVCLYGLCPESANVKSVRNPRANPRFVINHTKKEYVDIKHVECENPETWGSKYWFIHPLPLLACEGCGRGGGDYHQSAEHPSYKYVGAWARDIISVSNLKADVEGFKEIRPDFHETF